MQGWIIFNVSWRLPFKISDTRGLDKEWDRSFSALTDKEFQKVPFIETWVILPIITSMI